MDKKNTTPTLQGSSNGPAKKKWQKPDFYLLDTNNINTGNFSNAHHEASIVYTGKATAGFRLGKIGGNPTRFIITNYVS